MINRLGFNNDGVEIVSDRLVNTPEDFLGINIGPNKDSKRLRLIILMFENVYELARLYYY